MPNNFHLTTFQLDVAAVPAALRESLALVGGGRPMSSQLTLALEVFWPSDAAVPVADSVPYAVMLSVANDRDDPTRLSSILAFANGPDACNEWAAMGFHPCVDARIEVKWIKTSGFDLTIQSPCFGVSQVASDGVEMSYEEELLKVRVRADGNPGRKSCNPKYSQEQCVPDSGSPSQETLCLPVTWEVDRTTRATASASIEFPATILRSRYPDLSWLSDFGKSLNGQCWVGDFNVWPPDGGTKGGPVKKSSAGAGQSTPRRVRRTARYGIPEFYFDDVDVVGFRLDLRNLVPDQEARLQLLRDLVGPLNFHLEATSPKGSDAPERLADFEYVAANSTLVIELLRYGAMRAGRSQWGLSDRDFQSQHELIVRLLVGRVDEDAREAHDPALFAPAIFVDNAWSKIMGREVQGFDKRMVQVFARSAGGKEVRLLPNGRPALPRGHDRMSMRDIHSIRLVEQTGVDAAGTSELLSLRYSDACDDGWDALEPIDLSLAMGASGLVPIRWQQSDFEQPEFRRQFARLAMRRKLTGFRSIQFAPVDDRGALPKSWIFAKFGAGAVRYGTPSGIATITLHAPASAPQAWQSIASSLGGSSSASIALPKGAWYRLRTSLRMTVDDGLAW